MIFPVSGVALAVVSIGFFLLAALDDHSPNYLLPILSIALWMLAILGLGWSFPMGFLLQVGLFISATAWNVARGTP